MISQSEEQKMIRSNYEPCPSDGPRPMDHTPGTRANIRSRFPVVQGLRHFTPAFRTFAGGNALDALPAELERCKVSRVLLICSASLMRHQPTMARLTGSLGGRLVGS